jgi:hypothetical protein
VQYGTLRYLLLLHKCLELLGFLPTDHTIVEGALSIPYSDIEREGERERERERERESSE